MSDRNKCDGCGGPQPPSGWRVLELWEAYGRASLRLTTTWQLCARCARRLKTKGPR